MAFFLVFGCVVLRWGYGRRGWEGGYGVEWGGMGGMEGRNGRDGREEWE
jgi:hypothetical protein